MRRRNKRQNKNRGKRRVSAPAAQSTVLTAQTPLRQIRLRHREFIADIKGTADFEIHRYEINPGMFSTFPWLATLANSFESYHFNALSFEYVPSCPTSVSGAIILAPDYDPRDDNSSTTKHALLSFQDSVRTSWWTDARLNCTKRNLRLRKEFYIRSKNVPDTDIKTYDTLNLWVGTQSATTDTLGELWVDYDVTLLIPQIEDTVFIQKTHEATGAVGTYHHYQPLGPFAADELSHWVSYDGEHDFDKVEALDTTGNGYVDSLAFLAPGKYVLNWILEGISSWVNPPHLNWTGFENDDGEGVETLKSYVYDAASTEAAYTVELFIPSTAFPWAPTLELIDHPRFNLTGGSWASDTAKWIAATLTHSKHSIRY